MKYLSTRQVARLLGVSVWTVRKWRARGGGPPYSTVNRSVVRYEATEVSEWACRRAVRRARRAGLFAESVLTTSP